MQAEAVGAKKLKYGLNYDEQAKLAAEEFAKKRKQRLLQVMSVIIDQWNQLDRRQYHGKVLIS